MTAGFLRGPTGSRGQALAEFALVLPVFLLLLAGVVDAGRLIYAYNTVADAARNGARVAIVNQALSDTGTCDTAGGAASPIGCVVQSGIALGLTSSDVQVIYRLPGTSTTTTGPLSPSQLGWIAEVTATTTWRAITPIIGQLIPPVTLSSTSKMPVERVCSANC